MKTELQKIRLEQWHRRLPDPIHPAQPKPTAWHRISMIDPDGVGIAERWYSWPDFEALHVHSFDPLAEINRIPF